MARGIDSGSHPDRQVGRERFQPAKGGTTNIDVPREQPGFMGWIEGLRVPRHTTSRASYPDTKIGGRPAGPVRGRRPYVEPYNWESRGQS